MVEPIGGLNVNYYTDNGVNRSVFDAFDELEEDDWLLRYEAIRLAHEMQQEANKSRCRFQLLNEDLIGQLCLLTIFVLLVSTSGLVGYRVVQSFENTQSIEVNR